MVQVVQKSKEMKRDYSISFVRFIAMIFIVVCHMMQRDRVITTVNGYTIEWAYWFNVGVQMFLFISGYLYGRKRKIDTVAYYKKGFTKILVEYYVFIVIVCLANCVFHRLNIDNTTYWQFFILKSKVGGLGHLWFVPTILFCYLLIPVFLPVIETFDKGYDYQLLVRSLLLCVLVHIVVRNFFQSFSAAYINCFLIGIVYSFVEKRNQKTKNITHAVIVLLCFAILLLRIKNEYMPHDELTGFLAKNYNIIKEYGHVFLGITLFFSLRYVYCLSDQHGKQKRHHVLDWSDKYSYDVYLTHHLFVQSAFGVVEFISARILALPLAVLLTCMSSVVLHWLSYGLQRLFSCNTYKSQVVSKIQNGGGYWLSYSFGYISDEKIALMGLSILWVMFFHGTWEVDNYTILSFLKRYGNIGVDIFLLLSGVGLYYSFQRLSQAKGTDTHISCIAEYYKRRFLRIIPVTIVCLLPWYLYLYRNDAVSVGRVILDITSLSYWIDGKNRGWYVALTIALYTIYPLVYYLITKIRKSKGTLLLSGGLVISSIVINVAISLAFPEWYSAVELALARIPIFLFGCAIAPLIKENKEKKSVFVICVVMIPLLWILLEKYRKFFYMFSLWRYLYGTLGFCITVTLSWLLHMIHKRYKSRFLVYIGNYTLEIYLIHTQILTIFLDHLKPVFNSTFSLNLFAVLVSITLAVGLHGLVERILSKGKPNTTASLVRSET